MTTSTNKLTVSLLAMLAAASLAAATGCAATTESPSDPDGTNAASTAEELRIRLGANGDSCSVRTNPDGTSVPGTEKDGECCSNADTKDCVIILKPFPTLFRR